MERVRAFLDPLAAQAGMLAASNADADPIEVHEFSTMRDASDKELVNQVQQMIGDAGKIIPNPDRNTLLIWAPRSKMPLLRSLMEKLDTQPQQVMINSQLIEVTLDEYMGYGLEIFSDNPATNLNDGRFTVSGQDTQNTVGGLFGQPTGFDPFFATFTNPRVDIRLELLATEGKVKTLSRPWTMASNKKQARIEVGQEIPFLSASSATGGGTTVSVSFKDVSIVMLVTPTVMEKGLLRLEVDITVREVIGNVAIEGNNTPVLSKRQSQTDVFIRDGESLVMGGLMRERERTDESGIPFLKDIPFLGYLFKSANQAVQKTDLLFIIRPTIVNANGNQNASSGLAVVRDVKPIVYEDADAKKAGIREGRYDKPGLTPKPKHYNQGARPKTSADVDPGA
jgi:general secretion pathway protein D